MKLDALNEPVQSAYSSEPPQEGLHLIDLMIILSRRRRFIGLVSIGAAILTTVFVLLIPSQCTAETVKSGGG